MENLKHEWTLSSVATGLKFWHIFAIQIKQLVWFLGNFLSSDRTITHTMEGARLSGQSWGFECERPGFKSPTRTTE